MNDRSPLAEAMARAIAAHHTDKVPWRTLVEAAAAVDVSGVGTVSWRSRLVGAIDELAADGTATLPAPGGPSWDRRTDPPTPNWARRPRAAKDVGVPSRTAVVWDAALDFAARMDESGGLTIIERDVLIAVNRWLRGQSHLVVPVRERSWELFGDEKALERLRRGRLFGRDRLTDALLAIEPTFAPVDVTCHGSDPEVTVVIVENWTTYHSLGWAAERCGWQGTILWGAGNQAKSRIAAAADELPRPASVRYFGDVDVVGLRLARDVAEACAEVAWPVARPASGLYRLLVDVGGPIPHQGRAPTVPMRLEPWLADWFADADMARWAVGIAAVGRIPQEAVGRERLAGLDLADLLR